MKSLIFACCALILPISAGAEDGTGTRWEIREDSPVYGLSLRYLLPLEQLQEIAGGNVTPRTNDEGMGYLNLTFMVGDNYYLDGEDHGSLKEAHVLVFAEDSAVLVHSAGMEALKLNDIFRKNNFANTAGDIDLAVENEGEFLSIEAHVRTANGRIAVSARVLDEPGERVSADAVRVVSAQSPDSYFIGPESSRRISIDSFSVTESGDNWISDLQLPARPQSVSFAIFSSWDFRFVQE